MKEIISPIIEATALLKLYKSRDLIIVDASNGKCAKSNYKERHLDGALFVDLNTELADIKDNLSHGGRHPLPDLKKFSISLANLGISPTSHVIVYDDKNGSNAAARFWWMLKAIGHKKVQVLNGGIQEAERIKFPMNSKVQRPKKTGPYKIDHWKMPLAQMADVESVSQDERYLVIDVREAARYNGEIEPIDLIAGHIPGAINIPFTENLNKNGLFLSSNELKEKYTKVFGEVKSENIIFHCGSGVTACHSILALAHAGLEIPKVYVGSWSEWSRNNKKIEKSIGK